MNDPLTKEEQFEDIFNLVKPLPQGSFPGEQAACPIHGVNAERWSLDADHYDDTAWRCLGCLEDIQRRWRATVQDLEQQLAEAKAALGALAEALTHIAEYWNGESNQRALEDAMSEAVDTANAALASDFVQQTIEEYRQARRKGAIPVNWERFTKAPFPDAPYADDAAFAKLTQQDFDDAVQRARQSKDFRTQLEKRIQHLEEGKKEWQAIAAPEQAEKAVANIDQGIELRRLLLQQAKTRRAAKPPARAGRRGSVEGVDTEIERLT